MAFDLNDTFLRPSVRALEPYDPAFTEVRTYLSANENNLGLPRSVTDELSRVLTDTATNRYPRPLADELKSELARVRALDESQIIVGNGGDELIFNLILACAGPGRPVLVCSPTFSIYALYAELLEAPLIDVAREPTNFAPNIDALEKAASSASLVFLTSPNNPTGDLFPREGIRRILEACPGLVCVDEAYIEFAGEDASAQELMSAYPKLCILRTFSKAYALAGARVGYLMASSAVTKALAAVRQPYSVNVFSQAAALCALRNRKAFEPSIELICSERERCARELSAMPGVHVWPSDANFLLVRVESATAVWEELRDRYSILVRDFSRSAQLNDCLRISIGTAAENTELIRAFRAILSERS